ncbi:winged helix-turn-helix domain-containing protein [Yoonia sp. SS1-5]|uniref:Winged helix-turn-helix domain-containing protein n=1 Tax=Yoonia rhodophyticola TaxID=3137370 RepID=A0ABZ3JCE5_9RHOB
MTVPILPNRDARHLFLHKHGLDDRPSGPGKGADLCDVLDHLGFVQLDSVNTFARAHDLILWARRQQYRPRALQTLLQNRSVFEHWTHDAAAIPMALFPHWRLRFARDATRMETRWKEWRRGDFTAKIDDVLRHISDNGACGSGDVGTDEVKGSGGWWDWHPSKTALEYLWRSGQLSVTKRVNFRKIYDLTEKVIPPEALNARPHVDDTIEALCAGALDRLGFATSGELSAFWDTVTPAEAKNWCAAALADKRIIEVDIACTDGKLRRSFAWPDVMDAAIPASTPRLRILSPFDPALRDRKRAERLFGFHYRIEIFVPAAKRQYGYYVFPVMEGDRMIGRIDMARDKDVLRVTAFWPEPGVRMGAGRIAALEGELARAARFGGCAELDYASGWLRQT